MCLDRVYILDCEKTCQSTQLSERAKKIEYFFNITHNAGGGGGGNMLRYVPNFNFEKRTGPQSVVVGIVN